MIYEKYIGKDTYYIINDLDTTPYTEIGNKAFLSCKTILHLQLPSHIVKINDWAFAHMHNMTTLVCPSNEIEFGKDVFKDCHQLTKITLYPDYTSNQGLPYFLANSIRILKCKELLNTSISTNLSLYNEWIKKYDTSIIKYIEADDLVDYEPVFYGWFNVEDSDLKQLPLYLKNLRYKKVFLCINRLLYPADLSLIHKEKLEHYLLTHLPNNKVNPPHTATLDYIVETPLEQLNCIKLLASINGLTPELISSFINLLSPTNPELITYLINLQDDTQNTFFSTLEL